MKTCWSETKIFIMHVSKKKKKKVLDKVPGTIVSWFTVWNVTPSPSMGERYPSVLCTLKEEMSSSFFQNAWAASKAYRMYWFVNEVWTPTELGRRMGSCNKWYKILYKRTSILIVGRRFSSFFCFSEDKFGETNTGFISSPGEITPV